MCSMEDRGSSSMWTPPGLHGRQLHGRQRHLVYKQLCLSLAVMLSVETMRTLIPTAAMKRQDLHQALNPCSKFLLHHLLLWNLISSPEPAQTGLLHPSWSIGFLPPRLHRHLWIKGYWNRTGLFARRTLWNFQVSGFWREEWVETMQ